MCPNCSVSLTLHRGRPRCALCHYCGHETPHARAPARPATARTCGSRGYGTEKVVEAVQAALPDGARGAPRPRPAPAAAARWRRCSPPSRRGEIDILVGTQMIAKGHDFPRVTLVGVVDADVGPGHARLPRRRADVPAPDPGRGPRGPRRARGRGDPAEPPARPLRAAAGLRPGLRGLLRARDGVPPHDGLPAGRGAREPDPALARRGEGPPRRAARWRARAARAARGGRYRVLGPAPRAAGAPAAGAPLPDPAQGRARGDARGRAASAGRALRRGALARGRGGRGPVTVM